MRSWPALLVLLVACAPSYTPEVPDAGEPPRGVEIVVGGATIPLAQLAARGAAAPPPVMVAVTARAAKEERVARAEGGDGAYNDTYDPEKPERPPVTVDTPNKGEGLDKATIRRSMQRKLPWIQSCYEKQLLLNPELAGTVNVEFSIGASGRVTSVSATGLGDATVERCVEEVVRSVVFPPPPDGRPVNVTSYPFTFGNL